MSKKKKEKNTQRIVGIVMLIAVLASYVAAMLVYIV